MIHVSPAPIEVGCFDVDEANILAQEIREGHYQSTQTELSGRFVVVEDSDISQALGRIGYCTFTGNEPSELRTRLYAQDFAEIDLNTFPGLPWHIDSEGATLSGSKSFEFCFGFSSHATQAFIGRLDLTEIRNYLKSVYAYGPDGFPEHAPMVIQFAKELIEKSFNDAEESGDGHLVELDEGVAYLMPVGLVHRMQPFDEDKIYPARLCVEQYLKPTKL